MLSTAPHPYPFGATRSLVKFTEGLLFPTPTTSRKIFQKVKTEWDWLQDNILLPYPSPLLQKSVDWSKRIRQTNVQTLEKLNCLLPSKVTQKQKVSPLEHSSWSTLESKLHGHLLSWGKGTEDTWKSRLLSPSSKRLEQRTVISTLKAFQAAQCWSGSAPPLSHAGRHCPWQPSSASKSRLPPEMQTLQLRRRQLQGSEHPLPTLVWRVGGILISA